MADQDEVTPGAIPPKVSPFAKPEGAAVPASPGAPRPITVRLKPAAAAASEGASAPAVGVPAPAAANPRATARVPVPESVAATAPAAIRPVTVRLRPVAPVAAPPALTHTPGSTQPISKVDVPAVSPLQPQPPPAPGSHPLPEGPKPPSVAQVQAAKSKTSRISLDSAIGVAPVGAEKEGPKTIRLKRPSDLATPSATPTVQKTSPASARQTSRIPDSALPSAEAASSDKASVTQKKTLKIKRPGIKEEAVTAEGEGESFPEGVQMTPISPMEFPEKAESSVFTTIAAVAAGVAAVVLLLLTLCLGAHAMGPGAGKNALASLPGPELPWAGRISD